MHLGLASHVVGEDPAAPKPRPYSEAAAFPRSHLPARLNMATGAPPVAYRRPLDGSLRSTGGAWTMTKYYTDELPCLVGKSTTDICSKLSMLSALARCCHGKCVRIGWPEHGRKITLLELTSRQVKTQKTHGRDNSSTVTFMLCGTPVSQHSSGQISSMDWPPACASHSLT